MIRSIAMLVLSGAWILALHMLLLAGAAPIERRADLHVAGWPANTPPVRLALLSDTHPSWPGDSLARLRETVGRINAARPDAVLIAGDLRFDGIAVTKPPAAAAIAPLAALRAPAFAVLGNHDHPDPAAVRAALARAGIRLLDNDAARLGPLAIVGVDDAATHRDDVPRALARWRAIGGLSVLLTHSPDLVPGLPPPVTIVLAGHTHCGQVSLPLLGPAIMPMRTGRRYACGIVREGARTTIVGAGLGTSIVPLRLGAAPDYWIVTIGR